MSGSARGAVEKSIAPTRRLAPCVLVMGPGWAPIDMQPKEFLVEEHANVKRALDETLRFDYGPPELTRDYYEECAARLEIIEKEIARVSAADVSALLWELSELAKWISYIKDPDLVSSPGLLRTRFEI